MKLLSFNFIKNLWSLEIIIREKMLLFNSESFLKVSIMALEVLLFRFFTHGKYTTAEIWNLNPALSPELSGFRNS